MFERIREKRRQAAIEAACDLFQIREHDGEVWITYNNFLVLPASMLKDDPVVALGKMRELYLKQGKKQP